MNFLAHIYLSGQDEDVIFGNFIGDEIKGSNFLFFPRSVIKGIRLHRQIDDFTDHHPLFLKSRSRLAPRYRMYSGIIVDIFYDHFLALYWPEYSDENLQDYAFGAYGLLIRRFHLLPARSRRILPFMITQNWLVGYSRIPDLKRVFSGMSRRTGNKSGMEHAVDDLLENYADFEHEFREFFPQLRQHAATCLANLNKASSGG